MTQDKLNSYALMYGSKITPAQAHEAITQITVFFVEANLDWIPENVNEALDTLRGFIVQADKKPKIKVVYEYKLRRADGKYLDRSNWSEKGKTYKNKAAVMTALGTYIGNRISHDPNEPQYPKERDSSGRMPLDVYEAYREKQKQWREYTEDRNNRAQYIPEDWIVIAIAINTGQEPKELDARTWYKSLKKPEDT